MLRSPLSRAALALAFGLFPPLHASQAVRPTRPAPTEMARAFDQAEGDLVLLSLPERATRPLEVELWLDGAPRTLLLAPHSLRGPGFQVLVQGADRRPKRVEPAPLATVRGFVADMPESFFAGSLQGGALSGILRLEDGGPFYGIQPVSDALPGADPRLHFVYDATHALPRDATCAASEEAPFAAPAGAADGGPGSAWTEIACDADFQFFQQNQSSVGATQLDIENVLNGVDAIYDNDVDIRYVVGTILVRTAEPDPYTTSDPNGLLTEFKVEWLTDQVAIHRDVAHLFTGKNLVGSTIGIAYLGGICGAGYGLSQSKFSSSMTSRVALTSHELGHNWTASHCDGISPCMIMCSGLGGCSGVLTSFGPSEQAQIEAKKLTATCTSGPPPTAAPLITSVDPPAVLAVSPGILQAHGSGFEWADQVTLGGATLSSPEGYVVLDDSTLFLTLDAPPALGSLGLVVHNSIGSSSAFPIAFQEAFPPLLILPFWALTGVDTTWTMGGEAGDLWFLSVAVGDDSTFSVFGYPLLVNGILVAAGVLDGLGTAELSLVIPPSGVGLAFFSQVATVDGASGLFHAASAVQPSFVLL